ncbi:unnamed protein product [Rhizophagus irregularis]|nr:unnamed protein product [Rhizophagus irregularis]
MIHSRNVEQFVNISQEQLNEHKNCINSQPTDANDSTRNMFDACVQPGTTIIEVGPHTFYLAHTMFFRYTKHQNLFFLRRSFHSSVISKNDMLQL